MPIFHDTYDQPGSRQASDERRDRAGSPLPWAPRRVENLPATITQPENAMDPRRTPTSGYSDEWASPIDREQLIERIKRAQSPEWPLRPNPANLPSERPPSRTVPIPLPRSPLLPAVEIQPTHPPQQDAARDQEAMGLEIERPRSALHSGDFRQERETSALQRQAQPYLSTSPIAPWHPDFSQATLGSHRQQLGSALQGDRRRNRSRATSQSSLSNFVYMPPTSPLVQQSNSTDGDFLSRPGSRSNSRSPERTSRRHTFSPHSFQTFRSSPMARSVSNQTSSGRALPSMRREGTYPYQAHQPRRSISSLNSLPKSTPHTPLVRPRRPSITDSSPLQHAPLVGSYEESILRGRMSTTPSKPLNFVAQIGVLGRGNCKSNLRCPPHVTVPFPAVFYSYNSGNGRIADDSPSPYVGHVDIENSLDPAKDKHESRRSKRHTPMASDNEELPDAHEPHGPVERRKREKLKRRSGSPKAPPGGSYRIPQQGQLQIVLKNPNKTAVKLFLVPYDLAGMEPGQKTFVRQRSYSAGPIIDMPVAARTNLGTDRPEAALSASDDPSDRPVLRYLIHIQICCPSKGRFYLYKSIRVVFANRVPDGKEKLRNETQLPEPRYSAYKPGRESNAGMAAMHSATAALANNSSARRRSGGYSLGNINGFDQMDGIGYSTLQPPMPPPATAFTGYNYSTSPVRPIPFNLPRLEKIDSRPSSRDQMDLDSPIRTRSKEGSDSDGRKSPLSPLSSSRFLPLLSVSRSSSPPGGEYSKLNKGDLGYGGNMYGSPINGAPGAGLLARRLKGLEGEKSEEEHERARLDQMP